MVMATCYSPRKLDRLVDFLELTQHRLPCCPDGTAGQQDHLRHRAVDREPTLRTPVLIADIVHCPQGPTYPHSDGGNILLQFEERRFGISTVPTPSLLQSTMAGVQSRDEAMVEILEP